jgi:hypothetical protein
MIEILNLRLRLQEKQQFKMIADSLQTTPSRLIRKVVRDTIGLGPDLMPQDLKMVGEAINQLAALGRNLNQLLRCIHQGQLKVTSDTEIGVQGLCDAVLQLKSELQQVFDRSRFRLVAPDA